MAGYTRKNQDYALQLTVAEDLESLFHLNKGAELEFTVSAKHGFSNSSIVKKKIYNLNNIEEGCFISGKSLELYDKRYC